MCRTLFRVAGTIPSPPCAGSVVVALQVAGLRAGHSRRVVDRVVVRADRADLAVAPADQADRVVVGHRVVALLP